MPLEDGPLDEAVYDSPNTGSIKSYDPADVQPTSPSPAPSSNAPGIGDTSGNDVADSGEQDKLPEFDKRYRDELTGLIYVGALADEFDWLGHHFEIRTLTTGELAEVALIAKPYADSEAGLKAWQAATVAACVVRVDGQPIAVPLTNEIDDTMVRAKFRYVMSKWFPPILDVIYQRYVMLEYTVRAVIEDMGKASG